MYGEFFKEMQWTKVGALAEGGQELPEYHLALQEYLQEQGISVLVKRKLLHDTHQMDFSQVGFYILWKVQNAMSYVCLEDKSYV